MGSRDIQHFLPTARDTIPTAFTVGKIQYFLS